MLRLLLPILFPSWRFFNTIGPSPRVMLQFDTGEWQEFCPKPERLSTQKRLANLFYNPWGNKNLFVHSCAVRLFDEQDRDAVENMFLAIAQAIELTHLVPPTEHAMLRWRVELLEWDSLGNISASAAYTSAIRSVGALCVSWQADKRLCR